MATTREQIVEELRLAGVQESDLKRIGADYWIDYIVHYRETGRCGSVSWSTVNFIPIISRLIASRMPVRG